MTSSSMKKEGAMKGMNLLRAEYIGSREFQVNTRKYMHKSTPSILTVQGKPKQVLVPYETMVRIVETLEGQQFKSI